MSFTHETADGMWSHAEDLASCWACPECKYTQGAAVLEIVATAIRTTQGEKP